MSNRTSIKSHFRTGDIPTQDNFYDFIDSVLNKDEDGITKKAGNPISVQAEGDVNGVQNLLFFYRNFADDNPSWKVSQNPRTDPQNPATNKPGLNISDGAGGESRLFIRSTDGAIGLGTIEPQGQLHVKQGDCIVENGRVGIGIASPGAKLHVGIGMVRIEGANTTGAKALSIGGSGEVHVDAPGIVGGRLAIKDNGNVGIGIANPAYKLQVAGSVSLGGFTAGDSDEWPNVIWYRDTNANWDEGLIKGNSAKGVYSRAGFGIHMHENRHFCFYSTNWRPLLDIEGGSGRTYVRGKLTIGTGLEALSVENTATFQAKNTAGVYENFFWPRWSDNIMYMNYGSAGFRIRNNASVDTMFMNNDCKVGIGTTTPRAKLDVMGNTMQKLAYAYLNSAGKVGTGTWDTAVSIYASNRIVAEEFNAISDSRVKTNILPSDGRSDLQTLARLQVVDYDLIESENHPCGKKKGFIAQQVEKILPGAVTTHADFTPSIFALPDQVSRENGNLTITTKEDHGLCSDDCVRLVTPQGNKDVTVMVVDEKTFRVADWTEGQQEIFVYGKQVQDFRTLNYDHIFCTGIGAVQELYRQLQQLKAELSWTKEKLLQYTVQ